MERDFMGLYPKDIAVKEELVDGACGDSEFARSGGVPWSSSSNASALHEFMSLGCKQDEKPTKNGLYPENPFSAKEHSLGGNTSAPDMTGTTEQWIDSKASKNAPAQLTIFYGGRVNVFDDISPEKAQAIMILARNMYAQSKTTPSKLHMQERASELPTPDQPLVNQSMNTPPSELPSPMSVSSHPIDQPGANREDVKVSKTAGMSTPHINNTDSPKQTSPLRSVPASAIMSSAVPQARKASLARFLEKRKERAMNAAPYK